jgi:hypothetical protein
MPPRKEDTAAEPVAEPVAPGPIQLEVRVDGKIKFLQRVHSYEIDQQDDHATIVGVLKLPVTE